MRLKDYLSAIGAKGGSQNTIAQREARDANLAKGRSVREKSKNAAKIGKSKMTTQPQADDAPFTTGEFMAWDRGIGWSVKKDTGIGPIGLMPEIPDGFRETFSKGDAKLIAASMNAATSLHRSGYDAQKVFEALPEIMKTIMFTKTLLPELKEPLRNLRRKQKP